MTIAVGIHDRRRFVRHGLGALLKCEPDIAVVVTSGTLDEAASRYPGVSVDVILVGDCEPHGLSEVVRRLRELRPAAEVIGLDDNAFTDREGSPLLDAIRAPRSKGGEAKFVSEPPPPTLTPRERQVLGGVARGLTAREIANGLGLSTRTVEHHKRRLYAKLGVQNQAHAVALAAELGEG